MVGVSREVWRDVVLPGIYPCGLLAAALPLRAATKEISGRPGFLWAFIPNPTIMILIIWFRSGLKTKGLRDMPDNIAPDFAPFEARMRREGLAQIVIDNFRHYYGVLAGGSVGLIAEAEIARVESARAIAELAHYHATGRRALRHAAVLKLNGGLGTSMGLDQAKSLLVVRDGLTFSTLLRARRSATARATIAGSR